MDSVGALAIIGATLGAIQTAVLAAVLWNSVRIGKFTASCDIIKTQLAQLDKRVAELEATVGDLVVKRRKK